MLISFQRGQYLLPTEDLCVCLQMDSHHVRIMHSSIRFMNEEFVNHLQKEGISIHGGSLLLIIRQGHPLPSYHLLDKHLSSPAANAVCSMQILSEGHLYSTPFTEVFSAELENCGQWFYAGNKSPLSLNDRSAVPYVLIGKNAHIF